MIQPGVQPIRHVKANRLGLQMLCLQFRVFPHWYEHIPFAGHWLLCRRVVAVMRKRYAIVRPYPVALGHAVNAGRLVALDERGNVMEAKP